MASGVIAASAPPRHVVSLLNRFGGRSRRSARGQEPRAASTRVRRERQRRRGRPSTTTGSFSAEDQGTRQASDRSHAITGESAGRRGRDTPVGPEARRAAMSTSRRTVTLIAKGADSGATSRATDPRRGGLRGPPAARARGRRSVDLETVDHARVDRLLRAARRAMLSGSSASSRRRAVRGPTSSRGARLRSTRAFALGWREQQGSSARSRAAQSSARDRLSTHPRERVVRRRAKQLKAHRAPAGDGGVVRIAIFASQAGVCRR